MKKRNVSLTLIFLLLGLLLLQKFFIIFTVSGSSMAPTFTAGDRVLATSVFISLKPGDVVILKYNDEVLIKRILLIKKDKIFVMGDNEDNSTDSRDWGLIPISSVISKVL